MPASPASTLDYSPPSPASTIDYSPASPAATATLSPASTATLSPASTVALSPAATASLSPASTATLSPAASTAFDSPPPTTPEWLFDGDPVWGSPDLAFAPLGDPPHPDAEIGYWIAEWPYVWRENRREPSAVRRYQRIYMVPTLQKTYTARVKVSPATWPDARLDHGGVRKLPGGASPLWELWECVLDPRKLACLRVIFFFGAAMYDPRVHPDLRMNGAPFWGGGADPHDSDRWQLRVSRPLEIAEIRDRVYVPVAARCAKRAGFVALAAVVAPGKVVDILRRAEFRASDGTLRLISDEHAGTKVTAAHLGPYDARSPVFAFSLALLEREDLLIHAEHTFSTAALPRNAARVDVTSVITFGRPISLDFLERVWFLPHGVFHRAGGHREMARAFKQELRGQSFGSLARVVAAIDRIPQTPLVKFCELPPPALRKKFDA